MNNVIEIKTVINASVPQVWRTLTDPGLIPRWMAEPEMEAEIMTTWEVGSPIVIRGFHHVKFENKGRVLRFDPERVLTYNFLSSLSRLPDRDENYCILEFTVNTFNDQTLLTLVVRNFPTEVIFRHVDFYWKGTMNIIKDFAEDLPV